MIIGIPIPIKIADMMKKSVIALERVGTGNQALRICCLNCQKKLIQPSQVLILILLESTQLSFFIILIIINSQIERCIIYSLLKMNENDNNHPILGQLKILKNRLDQKGKIIKILNSCIQIQQAALVSIVQQFEQHQTKIMRRLHRLQQINLRYIKDYLQIKKQNKVQDFIPIEHMFLVDTKQFIKHKMQSIKQIQTSHQQSTHAQTKKTVDNCIHLMKNYLTERKVNYDRMLTYFSDQRKKKMKDSKGLEGYRQNKEEAKFIDGIKVKIDKFGKRIVSIDNGNAVQVFHSRQEIQRDMNRLDPVKGQITLEQSKIEQEMFKSIIHELIQYNSMQSQEQYFLQGSFKYISDKFQSLCQTYGVQFINQSIQSMKNLSPQAKNSIINNRFNEAHSTSKGQFLPINKMQSFNQGNQNYEEHRERVNKKMSRNEQYEQNQYEQDSQLKQNRKLSRVNRSKANNSLNDTFQKAKTKTFFQQQQKSRDQLISKQQQQIAQHEKVIDKLINFIKKEFKDLNMDEIDADDPEQLMGYYFKMNEKKYVDIKEEMEEIQSTNASNAKKVHSLTFENESLNIKIASLKEEMQQLLQKYQTSTFEFHILISSTQDLVKLSLQTLINTCMNNITPQELIAQLEKIISMIKDNIEKKRNITYKLTVKQEHLQSKEPKTSKKDYIAQHPQDNQPLEQMLFNYIFKQKIENSQSLFSAFLQPQKQPSQHEENKKSEQIHLQQPKQENEAKQNQDKKQSKPVQQKSQGFDESFLKSMVRQIQILKGRKNPNQELQDIKEMYAKYKQALDCLERAQHLNRENQIKYQHFLSGLKKKGAWGCPEKLQEKLFYMQKLIAQQNQLLQNQRAQYEETILKQVSQSQHLAENVLKRLKLKRRETKA